MLCLRQFRKTYSGRTILQLDDLCLSPGLYWIRGENGAGKTTLFKSIAGLIPFEGQIEVNGINLRKNRRTYASVVSYAEAEPVYPRFLTGAELVRFYQQTKGGNEENLRLIAQWLSIDRFLSQPVATYSSGMLKKLSLLLAFAGKPEWILLDEPFITLDTEAVAALQLQITEQHREGVSFFISTHQPFTSTTNYRVLEIRHQTLYPEPHVAGA